MKIAFFSDTKRIKKVVIGLILFITFFPIMTVSSFVSSLSSNQAGHLKEFCDCLPESEDIHPSIAIQNALLDIPPLIKKDKILKEYVIKKQPYSCTTFVHIVIYDDYHSIYFADYYIPF